MIFDGLLDDFTSLMTIVYNRETPCSVSQVEPMVIAHEARFAKKHQIPDVSASALLTVGNPVPSSNASSNGVSGGGNTQANYASGP